MSEVCSYKSTEFPYEVVRSKRKTMTLSISKELKVIVKAPLRMPQKEIETFVCKHTDWLHRHMVEMEQRKRNVLSKQQIESLKSQARITIPLITARFSAIMGVTPQSIKITSATTRWGSCSGKNSLCFTYRIMLLPVELIDYIVVHELAHIRVKNHSSSFYTEVEKYMPDYKKRIADLKKKF